MTEPALRLYARDFDAYLPERATSNAFSRPRIELKQRAMAWARAITPRVTELELRVELTGSDETPSLRNKKRVDCQWVFFRRDESDRQELDRLLSHGRPISAEIDDPSALKRHLLLGLRLDSQSVSVCVALHPDAAVDLDNLQARLADPGAGEELVSELERLPEQFQVAVGEALPSEEVARIAATAATSEALRACVVRASATMQPLCIGWWVARDVALEHADQLGEQLGDALVALCPVYRRLMWARDNDHVALEARLEGAERERARAHAAAFAETERWRAEREAERTQSAERARQRQQRRKEDTQRDGRPPLRPTLGSLFKGPTAPARAAPRSSRPPPRSGPLEERPVREPPAPVDGLLPPRSIDGLLPSRSIDGLLPSRSIDGSLPLDDVAVAKPLAAASGAAVDKGSRVRVLSGPFMHKLGVVSELDGRGGARVLLGLLSTRLDLADLELAVNRRDRPALQSSHRSAPPRKAR